ncbi:MAG: nicotinamidase/pyrazinamidase [Thermosipho sp. (in: thermotogales)]|nr:nicotinamidase/pyrazinamidase [Thermosipho sp. (in: thermotogales)]MDN5324941.1 nicotinamidase/pyrazinamidase [Thermosipho sp. (in: thermotogales)]
MKALFVIDMQNDFAKKGGALYFDGADKIIPFVLNLIEKYKSQNLPIIFTQDWHKEDDKEFEIWPKHCIKNTYGAEIIDEIKKIIADYKNAFFIKKNRYSAFFNTNLDKIVKSLKIEETDVVGLVTNICVLFTVEELRNRDIKVNVFKEGTISYDNYMYDFSLKLMNEVLNVNIK